MKRSLLALLVLSFLLSLIGCGESKTDSTTKKESAEVKVQFSDDYPLFLASDRCDKEGDRDITYSYNYKGELISESQLTIGYYAENGLAVAYDKSTGLYGYVNKEGVYEIEPIYSGAAPFSKDGIALVEKQDGEEKLGYINSKGEEIIPFIYDGATSFYDCGYAIVIKNEDTYDEEGLLIGSKKINYIIDKKGREIAKTETENEISEYGTIATVSDTDINAVFNDYYVCRLGIYDFSGKQIYEFEREESLTEYCYTYGGELYKKTIELDEKGFSKAISIKKFDGKKFVDTEKEIGYKCYSKHVATTQSGYGYGVEVDGVTKIPFEYDQIVRCGDYFVAVKYNDLNDYTNQTLDIYDKNYKKTAENIKYAFVDRSEVEYGRNCALPNGYFEIAVYNSKYNLVYGVIDYTGKIIVEPVYGDKIIVNSYAGTGRFSSALLY